MIDPTLKEEIEEEVWSIIYLPLTSQLVSDKIICFENLSNDLKFKMAWDEFSFVFFDYCFFCAREQAALNKSESEWVKYPNYHGQRKDVYKDRVHRFYHSKLTKTLLKAYQQ